MVVLLQAVIDTMRSSSTTQHETRQQRRKINGLGNRPLAKLILSAARNLRFVRGFWLAHATPEELHNIEEDKKLLYTSLLEFLEDYANIDPRLKKQGAYLPSVQFTFDSAEGPCGIGHTK